MIPRTTATHLHHVDGERVVCQSELCDLVQSTRGPGRRAQIVSEDPRDLREVLLAAYRADRLGDDPVEARRAEQIDVGIAHLTQ